MRDADKRDGEQVSCSGFAWFVCHKLLTVQWANCTDRKGIGGGGGGVGLRGETGRKRHMEGW